MRIAYLDCFSGISGDMFLGALVDAGVPFALLQRTVAELNIGAELELSRVDRGGVSACKIDVLVNGEKDLPREEFWAHHLDDENPTPARLIPEPTSDTQEADSGWLGHGHVHPGQHGAGSHRHEHTHIHSHLHTHADGTTHAHEHSHTHTHAHDHGKPHKHERGDLRSHAHHGEAALGQMPFHEHQHEHDQAPAHPHSHGRKLSEILSLISGASISESARRTASDIFRVLGEAEAKVHNVAVDDIHFHEVGAADAIVDIVCAAIGAEALGVEQFVSSPLNVGGGMVTCAHGTLPVPAPATLEILRGVPIYSGEIHKELVTPTGAAIAKVLVSKFGPRPVLNTEHIGYGAGTRDFAGNPNVLRLTVGETVSQLSEAGYVSKGGVREEIVILEANLDDLNPQLIGYIVEQALALGALDAFTTPVQMKKNRPGTLLTVLAKPEDEQKVLALLFRESSTLGVRTRYEQRVALPRHHQAVITPWGEVRMKIASLNGTVSQYTPEYEDCRRIALKHNVPLKTVMQEAVRIYLDQKNG